VICVCEHAAFVHIKGVCTKDDLIGTMNGVPVRCDCIEFTEAFPVRPANWLDPIALPVTKFNSA
jgi:hypothetical protein